VTTVREAHLADLPASTLYALLRLRAEVFVVEQRCAYLDPDGRDLEPGCRQLWLEGAGGAVVATARLLDDGGATRIGRVATAPSVRGEGHARRLVEHALATAPGPWVLDAQSHLAEWYRALGFEPSGPEFVEDGIPHVPMRRER
jgi:ElaA protein